MSTAKTFHSFMHAYSVIKNLPRVDPKYTSLNKKALEDIIKGDQAMSEFSHQVLTTTLDG